MPAPSPHPPRLLPALALALAAASCQAGSGPPAPEGAAAGANATAAGNLAAASAVAAPPPVLELRGTAAFAMAGAASTPLEAGVETGVDPRSTFRVELPTALADARLSLLDGGDALVPCSGSREIGQATVLTLAPASALAAGARLRLRIDGAATRELHGADGRRFAPLEWPVVVAGEALPRKPAARKGTRR